MSAEVKELLSAFGSLIGIVGVFGVVSVSVRLILFFRSLDTKMDKIIEMFGEFHKNIETIVQHRRPPDDYA